MHVCICIAFNIISISQQGRHSNCNAESACRKDGYIPSKIQLKDPVAITAYTKKLKETLIYTNAESYCHVSAYFSVV